MLIVIRRRKKEEVRGKKEEGRSKREEGRRKNSFSALTADCMYRTPDRIYLKEDGEMGGWGDGEMRVFFYLQGKLPGALLGDTGSHSLFPLF
ncbi:hypothetical protein [Okeania sp. SIO1I7]|uniref:hypothetical protein n=1 Tax=Okeania sp. SIO1I7 TaxID=2607772 RepID=UPI0013FBDE28|nr:hypothetical protein [Okeania sp. SIO1I7]NET27235.1 hypothetical protein [Okeania sp. SIO1I7]